MRLLLALSLVFASCAEASPRIWSFRVLLDGSEIGRHTFTREEAADGARVVSEARWVASITCGRIGKPTTSGASKPRRCR